MSDKYNVHLYATVRVTIEDVEADDMLQAVERAEEMADLDHLVSSGKAEYAEEILEALVNVVGDEEYLQTRRFVVKDFKFEEAG